MPLLTGVGVSATFSFLDEKGKASSTVIRFRSGFSIAQYIEAAQAVAQTVANLSVGRVTGVTICFGADLSGETLRLVAALTAQAGKKLLLQFRTVVNRLFTRANIPTLDEALILAGSDGVDPANAAAAALIAAFETGVTLSDLSVVAPTDKRGNDIASLVYGREIFLNRS